MVPMPPRREPGDTPASYWETDGDDYLKNRADDDRSFASADDDARTVGSDERSDGRN